MIYSGVYARRRLGLRSRSACMVLAAVLLLPTCFHHAHADEEAVEVASSSEAARHDFFDRVHARCSEWVFRLAGWTDDLLENGAGAGAENGVPLLADEQLLLERYADLDVRRSHVRLSPSVRLRESGEVDFDFGFSARLRLPRASRRARLVLDRTDWLPELGRDFEGRSGADIFDRDAGRGTASLVLPIYQRTRYRLAARAGLRFAPEPEPRLQLGLYASRRLTGDWMLRPHQAVFWDADGGFGEKTVLEVQRHFADRLLVRLGNELIWSESSRGAELAQYVHFYRFLSNRRMIGAKVGAFEYTHPNTVVDQYRIRFPYRQRVWKSWMYIEIEPGGRFLREDNYRFSPELTITVDLLAGNVSD